MDKNLFLQSIKDNALIEAITLLIAMDDFSCIFLARYKQYNHEKTMNTATVFELTAIRNELYTDIFNRFEQLQKQTEDV